MHPARIIFFALTAPIRRLPCFLLHAFLPALALIGYWLQGRDLVPVQWAPEIHSLINYAVTLTAQGVFLLGWYRHLTGRKGPDWPLILFFAAYGLIFILQEIFNYLVGGAMARIAEELLPAATDHAAQATALWQLGFIGMGLSAIAYWLIFRLSLGLPGRAGGEAVSIDRAWRLGAGRPVQLALVATGLFLAEFLAVDFLNMAPGLFPGLWDYYSQAGFTAVQIFQFSARFYMMAAMAAAIVAFLQEPEG